MSLTAIVFVVVGNGIAQAAAPAQVGGKVTNLPAKTSGGRAVQVVAVHFPDGRIVDADRVDAAGRYALKVPAGVNGLVTQVVPATGARSTSMLSAAVKLKPGERRKLKLKAKKRKRRGGRGNGHGGGGHGGNSNNAQKRSDPTPNRRVVGEDGTVYPGESFAFKQFIGATGDWKFANGGLPDLFTTDAMARPPGCEYTLVERRRFDLYLEEIALGQSGLADPEAAVEPGHLIPVELWIEGTLTNEFDHPAPLRYEIRIVEAATGTVRTTLRGLLGFPTFFDDQEALGRRLVQAMCAGPGAGPGPGPGPGTDPPPPPVAPASYSGEISGDEVNDYYSPPYTISWSGNVAYTLVGESSSGPGLPEPGPYGRYEVASGSAHVTADWPNSECGFHGEADLAIPAGTGGSMYLQEGVDQPAYTLSAQPDGAAYMTVTRSGTDPECTGQQQVHIGNTPFAYTPSYQRAESSVVAGSSTFTNGANLSINSSTWDLAPGG